jgi:diguanylate cyclase (GGDEF)-like protein
MDKGGSTISDLIVLPIINDGSAAGQLVIGKYDNQKFSPLDKVIINYIERYSKPLFEFFVAEQIMDKVISKEATRATVDSLTGLYNLEFLIGFLQQQLLFSFRNKLLVSLLMIDIDRFSQVNSVVGPAVADTILVKIAEKLLSIIRGSDLLARYSGDKFVIVLPNTPLKGARVLAEKIRLEIEQTNFFAGRQPGPSLTVSVGLAEYDPHDLNPETILKDAKTALQKAKENGRNKVAL